jgi:hypothetical protein
VQARAFRQLGSGVILRTSRFLAHKAALQLRQIYAPKCVPNAQKAQKMLLFLQNPCHFGTETSSFYTDFARAVPCFHRFTGFGRKKIRDPFSGIPRWEQSPIPQGHLAFRLAKYLHKLSKQRVPGLGGSQSRPGRFDDGARRSV